MGKSIEMSFGLRTQVDPRNHALDGGPDPPAEWAILGVRCGPLRSIGRICREPSAKLAELIEMSFGLWARVCPSNNVLDVCPDTLWEGAFLGGKEAHCKV